jgi:hypothetical protein
MGASVMDMITYIYLQSISLVNHYSFLQQSFRYCDRFPKPGETVSGNEFRKGTGGKSANACVMSARLGLKSAMLAKVIQLQLWTHFNHFH